MIKKISDICQRFFCWTYNNSYLTFCIVAILFLLGLVLLGCLGGTFPDSNSGVPADNVPEKFQISILNERPAFYIVNVQKNHVFFWSNIIVDPQETELINLEKGKYTVCISKEFSDDEKCFPKEVVGEDKWIIKKR